ncbi:hypothetical protein DFH07DRAFT_820706 [Mycena maculata]|uniref:SHSP domain-containing protein n=1 Tax=Mycena maculata TaxID=230809 RepID=A0AAD7J657_9AGAR|nr:hypothetical protein DFH07DRAFT_820706 [Mycena maculata]
MASPVPQPDRIDVISPGSAAKPVFKRLTSPITPATTAGVTGLVFPLSPADSSPNEPLPSPRQRPLRRMSRIDSSSSTSKPHPVEISSVPPQLEDGAALDDLWNTLRLEKELKMNKERPKVKSLEDYRPATIAEYKQASISQSPSPRPASRSKISDLPTAARESPSPPSAPSARTPERRSLLDDVLSNDRASQTPYPISGKIPKKKKSITIFRTSPEKNYVVAIFDLRGVDRDDIRVTFRRDHIMVSWEKWEVENWEEEDCICRRTVERVYHRVIPLAEGIKFRDIYGTMKGEDLLLRYPLVGINGSRSGES